MRPSPAGEWLAVTLFHLHELLATRELMYNVPLEKILRVREYGHRLARH